MDWACLLAVVALTVAVLAPGLTGGALADPDEAAHAMDGVLIRDWVAAGPSAWLEPMQFAEQQYGHYPTLGIGRHYPPGFAIVEAAFFGVFGVSVLAARLCVLFFAILATIGIYLLLRQVTSRQCAAWGCLIFAVVPGTTTWGRQIMLEIPTLTVGVWTALLFTWYCRKPNWTRWGICTAAALSAILFKQTAVIVIGAVTIGTFWLAIRKAAPLRHPLAGALASVIALVLVVLGMDDACQKTLAGYDTFAEKWGLQALVYYAVHLPTVTGAAALILAAVGALALRRLPPALIAFLLGWLLLSYAMVTVTSLKVPRFTHPGTPPVVIFAALGADWLLRRLPAVSLRHAATTAAFVFGVCVAMSRPNQTWADYRPVVTEHLDLVRGRPVLFSGLRDGDFIFSVRQLAAWRNSLVVRGSKLFYTCTAGPDLDLVPYVGTSEDLAAKVRDFAFPYIFIERENYVATWQDRWLREYLAQSGDYRLLKSHALRAHTTRNRTIPVTIDVYELAGPLQRQVEIYEIPMPRTGTPIRMDLRRFQADPLATSEPADTLASRKVRP